MTVERAAPSGGSRRKRVVYAALAGLAATAAFVSLLTSSFSASGDSLSVIMSASGVLVFGVIALLAPLRRVPLRTIEHFVFWCLTGVLVLTLALRLYGDPASPAVADAVTAVLLWVPLLFVFSAIAFDGEAALRRSVAVFLLVLLVTLPHALGSVAGPTTWPGLNVMLQAYLAYTVLIVALFLLSDMQGRVRAIEEAARAMSKLAHTDALTGLANRRQVEEILSRELRRAERYGRAFSVLMLDIDHFKELNDRFGHQAGDEVLVDLARRFERMVRASDSVARWGGEEFVIVTPETGLEDAKRLAELVRRHVNDATLAERFKVTVSIGVACYRPGDSVAALVARSDAAMYQAKRAGRNRVRHEVVGDQQAAGG